MGGNKMSEFNDHIINISDNCDNNNDNNDNINRTECSDRVDRIDADNTIDINNTINTIDIDLSADRVVNEYKEETPADQVPTSILEQTPPCNETGNAEQFGSVGVYGISIQGKSHVAKNQCCQDYNSFWYLPDENIWILAIADGVGSCSLSHWGAYTAVSKAIEFLRERLCSESASAGHAKCLANYTVEEIETIYNDAFTFAQKEVENFADANQQPVFNFQSTLTVALYDGQLLYCCHVGDDGIVAEGVSGKYLMVTDRVKGDEANSVYTLQSGCWSVRRVNNVVALVMSTDGILDSYVGNAFTNNRVYYPFFRNLTYSMRVLPGESPKAAVKKASELAIVELTRKAVNGVSDDMTVLVAANQEMLDRPTQPQFSQEAWDQETEQLRKKQYDMLYKSSVTPKSVMTKPVMPKNESVPPMFSGMEQSKPFAKAPTVKKVKPSYSSFSGDEKRSKYNTRENDFDFHKRTADTKKGLGNKKAKITITGEDEQTPEKSKGFFKLRMVECGNKITFISESLFESLSDISELFKKKEEILICPECKIRFLGFSKCPYCKLKLISEEEWNNRRRQDKR